MDISLLSIIVDIVLTGITFAYFICTVFIFLSNCSANNLLKDQISDSKKQHEENKHLEILPYLKVDCTSSQAPMGPGLEINMAYISDDVPSEDKNSFKLVLENVGLGTAVDIQYLWSLRDRHDNYLSLGSSMILPNALTVGERREVVYNIRHPSVDNMIKKNLDSLLLHAGFIYQDLLSAEYRQDVLIDIDIVHGNPKWVIKNCYVERQKKLETSQEQNS